MHGSPSDNLEAQLEAAIAEFLGAVDAGRAADRALLLRRYSAVAADLEAFFADHDRMRRMADPVRPKTERFPATMILPGSGALGQAASSGEMPTLARSASSISSSPKAIRGAPLDASRYFGGYELLEEVARGGMGVVYKARHLRLNRVVALKMILAGQLASREDVLRFYAEAEAAAGLDHVGIVPVHEVAEHEGQHYFTMGFVEGESLADVISRGPLDPQAAAELMKKIAEAVAYAHSKGVIHRDLKPANVLLAQSTVGNVLRGVPGPCQHPERHGGRSLHNALADAVPKITDFGLAKCAGSDAHLTTTGQILGTPSYMPPEQAAGRVAEIRETADVYALGAILYAMLTGRPPFMADSPLDVLVQVLESEPTLPNKLHPGIPRSLEWICLRCLEKSPERRYPSATALAADLERFLQQEPVEARPAGFGQRVKRWVRREPALASHLAGVLLALLIAQLRFLQVHYDMAYHLRVSGLLVVWGISAVVFQQLLNRERWSEAARYLWTATDLLFVTLLLTFIDKPLGPLLVGYPLLVAASGLFFRVRLVVLSTILAMALYLALWYWYDSTKVPFHYACVLVGALGVLGFVVGYQVRRVRVLSQYYEHRNLP